MPGVDLVISALFETSGLRWEVVCATPSFAARASTTEAINEEIKYFTALILLRSVECKAAKHCRTPKRGRRCERRLGACVFGMLRRFWSLTVLRRVLVTIAVLNDDARPS
jgi:hypothetical protein